MLEAKPWLAHYQCGVPDDIQLCPEHTLVHLLDQAFQQHAERDMIGFMGHRWSFARIGELAQRLSQALRRAGLQRGDRVALMMPNVPAYAVAIPAVLKAGLVVVNVNPMYTPRELAHQLADSGASALIVLGALWPKVTDTVMQQGLKLVLLADGSLPQDHAPSSEAVAAPSGTVVVQSLFDVLAQPIDDNLPDPDIGPDDVAFLQYTGGTSGVSKGATLLHRHVVANVMQCEAWFKPELDQLDVPQLINICALPLYHVFALGACYLLSARLGSLNVLIANPSDIAGLVKELARYRFNQFPAVNTLYNALLQHPDFSSLDFSGLKVCNGGGSAIQRGTAERWMAVTGCPIIEGYGLSETSPVVAINRMDSREFNGSIGYPLPSTEIRILDESGVRVPHGEVGEIAVRGPQLMAGYWNRPQETAEAMTIDGFFRTGDLGVMTPEGMVTIVDRKKDMILVSGFNVYPNEIEQVVGMHPGVLECAAVGVPDERTGEAVRLFVVPRDAALTEGELMAFCREQLTGYKRPRHISLVDALPKTNVGKVLRRALKDRPLHLDSMVA